MRARYRLSPVVTDMSTEIIVAVIGLLGSVAVQFGGILVNSKLTTYRLEQLENKVNAHNNMVERIYKLEQENAVQDNRLAVADHRITDLENKVG
jgi:uncharacterized coiled-coil protein SlyX